MKIAQTIILCIMTSVMTTAYAADMLDYLTDAEGKYNGPTVEEKIAEMDTDNNGFADVYEVRAYLIKKHGEGYQQAVLARWEANANPNSCGATSFADELVANK